VTQKELMDLLHKTLAQNLLARVQDPEAKASDLNVARQFLKDNNVEGLATDSSPLAKLASTLPTFSDDDTDEMRH